MKKISKTAHHSLTELNITPLLDLGFVLLVIFIITTAPIVNDMALNLPSAAKREKPPKPKIQYVSVEPSGDVYLNRKKVEVPELLAELVQMRTEDPDINISLRGDRKAKYAKVVSILDALQQANIGKVNLATDSID